MKKVLGIVITRESDYQGFNDSLLNTALKRAEINGAATEKINLRDYNILQCRECSNCGKLLPCPLAKIEEDQTLEILNRIAQANALILLFGIHRGKLPELAVRLLNRITPKETRENELERFYSDVLPITKGTIADKETGIIYTGETASIGTDILSLFNSLGRLKLNLVVSVGIGIEENGFSKQSDNRYADNNYNYAVRMCEAVGERMGSPDSDADRKPSHQGKSAYVHKSEGEQKDKGFLEQRIDNIDAYLVYDASGMKVALKNLLDKTSVFIIGGPMAIDQNLLWVNGLNERLGEAINIYPIAEIDESQLPVSKDFILGKIKERIVKAPVLVDWKVCFHNELGIDYVKNYSTLLVINSQGTIIYKLEEKFSLENNERISAAIKRTLLKIEPDAANISDSQTKKVLINGLDIAYKKAGKGQPLLIIHGNRDKKEYFSGIIKALEPYFEVYAIDLRGHGDSDKPESGYKLEAFLEDIRQFVGKMGMGSLNIIGHSLGATLAMKTALDNPNVEKLILMGTSANFHPGFRPENIGINSIGSTNLNEDAVKDSIQNAIAPYFFMDEYPQVRETITGHWREIPAYMQRALVMELKHPDMREEISRIKSSTLVIAGEKDRITSFDQCKYVADNIKGSVLQVIQGTGHFMFLEKPDEVISTIKKFLGLGVE